MCTRVTRHAIREAKKDRGIFTEHLDVEFRPGATLIHFFFK